MTEADPREETIDEAVALVALGQDADGETTQQYEVAGFRLSEHLAQVADEQEEGSGRQALGRHPPLWSRRLHDPFLCMQKATEWLSCFCRSERVATNVEARWEAGQRNL